MKLNEKLNISNEELEELEEWMQEDDEESHEWHRQATELFPKMIYTIRLLRKTIEILEAHIQLLNNVIEIQEE